MAGLFGLLGMASRAMSAQSYGLDVTGQNLANVNTVGYARRVVQFGAVPPADPNFDAGGGVEVLGARAIRNDLFDRRLYQELPGQNREQAIVDALQVVQVALGQTGDSIDASMGAFFNAWSALSDNPTSPVARAQVVAQGQKLATDFANMAARLKDAQTHADKEIRSNVDQINTLTAQIASLNAKIAGNDPAATQTLRDQQIEATKKLAAIVDIQAVEQSNGTMQITFAGGQPLVVGETSYTIGVTNAPTTGLAQIVSQGTDVTSRIQGGTIAGLLETRDAQIPDYLDRLDTLAYGIVTQVNTLHDAGYTQAGTDAPVFFDALAGPAGAASSMVVNAAVVADNTLVAAGGIPGTPGDNQTARALADLRDAKVLNANSTTFADYWGQLVNRVGQDGAAAAAELASRTDVVNQIENLRDSVSGVSMDEETTNLMKFQRAYEANARYFTTINSVLETLMNIGA